MCTHTHMHPKGIAIAKMGNKRLHKEWGGGVRGKTVIFNGGSFFLSSLEREKERQRCLE